MAFWGESVTVIAKWIEKTKRCCVPSPPTTHRLRASGEEYPPRNEAMEIPDAVPG